MSFPFKVSSRIELMAKFGRLCLAPENTWIGENVVIGEGTIIEPNVYIFDRPNGGNNLIGKNCRIGTNSKLREWFVIEDDVNLGHCTEVVRSKIGRLTKAAHWCHIGDAEIGARCNIAAGVVFSNYDGEAKQKTIVEDFVFIGSLATLIAPVRICFGAYVGAHATITKNVPPYALVVGVNKISETKVSSPSKTGWKIIPK